MAWYSWRDTNPAGVRNPDIFYKTSQDNGATWSPDTPFTRFVGGDFDPHITALSGGVPALVWHSDRAGNNDIWYGVIGLMEDVSPPPILRSVTHRPFPNPNSNDAVTVTAEALDETGIAGVELVWSIDGVSTGDLPMFDDGAHGDGLSGDGTYGAEIGPFPVGTQVEYQVRATDTAGNTVQEPRPPNSLRSLEPFVAASALLLVFDDMNSSGHDAFYRNALNALGLPFDFWDGSLRGYVDLPTLNQYLNGLVIWAMPDSGFIFDDQAQANLASFLDAGGNLFISGQDLYRLQWEGPTFYRDYLHSSNADWCVGVRDVRGVPGDIIGDGLSFRIQGGDGANNQGCPQVVNPVAPALPVFNYVDLQEAAALPTSPPSSAGQLIEGAGLEPLSAGSVEEPTLEPYVPQEQLGQGVPGEGGAGSEVGALSHIRSGIAALRVDTGTYKLVYLAFGFEAIDSRSMREEVMRRVLGTLALGSISGTVNLQGRADYGGAKVYLVGTNMSSFTEADGSFVLRAVPEGVYDVEVTLPTYLTARKSGIEVRREETTGLPPLNLKGGDFNMDGKVNLLDLIMLSRNFGMTESEWK